MKLYLVRHGETEWNREHRIQGREDIPLNEEGKHQAEYCAKSLAGKKLDCIVSSPLARAKDTAAAIAAFHAQTPFAAMDGLVERDFAKSSGALPEEIKKIREKNGGSLPGAEERSVVAKRAGECFRQLFSEYPQGEVLAVTHGGVISAVLDYFGGPGYHGIFLDNVFISVLEVTKEGFKVVEVNVSPEIVGAS